MFSLAFFFAELIVGRSGRSPWISLRAYAGTASGMMNFGSESRV